MSALQHRNIRFVPSIHQRIAFAEEVRREVREFKPELIAIELPEALSSWIVRGVLRLPQISAVCFPGERPDTVETIPIDPCDSIIEAVRLALELELPIQWIDNRIRGASAPEADLPDDLMIGSVGLEPYVATVLPHVTSDTAPSPHEIFMAEKLREIDRSNQRTLCVIGLAHFGKVKSLIENSGAEFETQKSGSGESAPSAEGAYLTHLTPASIVEVLREIPFLARHREDLRTELHAGEGRPFDKLMSLREMLKTAETEYESEYRATVSLTQLKALYQYMRNLALARGRLGPDLYSVVMSAKGTVDGDFGYEVYHLARSYDLQDKESGLQRLSVRDGRGKLEGEEHPVEIESRFGTPPMEKISVLFRRRPTPEMKEIWKNQWEENSLFGICSWPPEDESQERFMDFLRKRALAVISKDKKQVVEFTTSLHDGLDIRETLRNWHTGKLYVQKSPQLQGRVGAVVVIFEDEALDAQYSWRCTLYAENNNESDISFYATPLGQEVVGPGIARTEFGGLLSIYPSNHIPDIWRFSGVEELGSCAEALLAAGILFSEDRYVAYVASRPPGSRMKELAARHGRHLIYMPITGFPRSQLKKVRKFHILNGHHVRNYAAEYIFEE